MKTEKDLKELSKKELINIIVEYEEKLSVINESNEVLRASSNW